MELELLLLWGYIYILIEMHGSLSLANASCTERVVACVEKKTQGLVAGTSLPRSHNLQDRDAYICSGIQSRTLYILCLFGFSALLELEMENFSSIRRVVVQGLKMHACWNRFLDNDLPHCLPCENGI